MSEFSCFFCKDNEKSIKYFAVHQGRNTYPHSRIMKSQIMTSSSLYRRGFTDKRPPEQYPGQKPPSNNQPQTLTISDPNPGNKERVQQLTGSRF